MKLSEIVKNLRRKSSLTQKEFAHQLRVDKMTV